MIKSLFLKVFFITILLSGCAVEQDHSDLFTDKTVKIESASIRPALQVVHTPNKLIAVLYSDNIFQNHSAKLKSNAAISLNQVLQIINNHPETHHIEITAYSDNTVVSNDFNNSTLLQANNIAAYLWDHGIPHKMISAKAKGVKNYISNNNTITGRADNRRIEISLVYNMSPPLV